MSAPVESRRPVFAAVLRRSVAARGAIGLVVLIVAHVTLRGTGWRHEWGWAAFQYQFVAIFAAPFAAGVASWDAIRWRRAQALHQMSSRWPQGRLHIPADLAWVVGTHIAGFLLPVAIIVQAGTPGWPTAADLKPFLSGTALLVAATVFGYVAGERIPHAAVPPIVAVLSFVVVLGSQIYGPERWTRFGGATASMIGLELRSDVVVGQTAVFSGAAMAVAAWGSAGLRRNAGRALLAAGLVAVIVGAWVLQSGPNRVFDEVPVDLVCDRIEAGPAAHATDVCVVESYTNLLPAMRRELEAVFTSLDAAGLPRPRQMLQVTPAEVEPGVGLISPTEITKHGRPATTSTVLSAAIPRRCHLAQSEAASEAFIRLSTYLDRAPSDDSAPTSEQASSLRRDFGTLSTCGAGG